MKPHGSVVQVNRVHRVYDCFVRTRPEPNAASLGLDSCYTEAVAQYKTVIRPRPLASSVCVPAIPWGVTSEPGMQALLNEILDAVRPLIGQGKVADYIPALGTVPADQLGIAVYGNDGELYCAGDAHTLFSVQSISKVFSLVQAIGHLSLIHI